MKTRLKGLSKKVPAIFEGLPEVERLEALEKQEATEESRPSRKPLLFIEIGEDSVTAFIKGGSKRLNPVPVVKRYPITLEGQLEDRANGGPLGAILERLVKEEPDLRQAETRVLWSKKGIFIVELEKPQVPPKDLRTELMWQIADILEFPVVDANLMFHDRGPKVLVAALKSKEIEAVFKGFQGAQIYPPLVTLQPIAYEAWIHQDMRLSKKNVLLVHLGSQRTVLMIFECGRLHSVREIPLGGDHVTQAMTGTFMIEDERVQIQPEEAERLKRNLGLPTPDLKPLPEEPKLSHLAAAVRPVLERLVHELWTSTIQFEQEVPREIIHEICLAGGGAELKGLESYLAEHLHRPARKGEFSSPNGSFDRAHAALMAFEHYDGKTFNFAPLGNLLRKHLRSYCSALKLGSLAIAGLLVLLILITGAQMWGGHHEIKRLERKLEELGPTSQKLRELESITEQINDRESLLREVIQSEPYLAQVLREVSRVIPPSLVLQKIHYRKQAGRFIEFEGIILPQSPSPDSELSDFLGRLNDSAFFKNSRLKIRSGSNGGEPLAIRFVIEAQVGGEQ